MRPSSPSADFSRKARNCNGFWLFSFCLIWFVLTRNFDDRFLNPLAMQEDVSNIIMQVLTEDDEVEENRALHNFIYNPDTASDYFKLKHVLIWLRRSYLLCSPLSEDRFERYVDSYLEHFNKSESTYYAETSFSMNCEIGPMAEKAHLWLADMYLENGMHEESEKLRSLKYCQQDLFEVIDADSEYAVVKNSNDEEFKMKSIVVFATQANISSKVVLLMERKKKVNGSLLQNYEIVLFLLIKKALGFLICICV